MAVPRQMSPVAVRYAEAILQNAANVNFEAAEGMLDSAWSDLVSTRDALAAGDVLLLVALNILRLPGRTGDVLSISLIEFVRSLLDKRDIEIHAKACKAFTGGYRDQIEQLPVSSFAATSTKLAFMGAEIVIALANGEHECAADMARFIDEAPQKEGINTGRRSSRPRLRWQTRKSQRCSATHRMRWSDTRKK
jgi:hypothetical protein